MLRNEFEPVTAARGARPPGRVCYPAVRAAVEFLATLGLLVVTAPVILVTALLTKLTSAGPAFYSQARLGKNGRVYRIFKIRTMVHNCESATGARWSTPGDTRVTRFGRFLRRTHLDELPQLWNVLRGEMSLIGPRPERPEFVPALARAIPRYRDRLLVRPGVTGLAQVQLPADRDLDDVRRKLSYDLFYVQNLNPWLDLRIILCTGLHMLGVRYHVLGKLFRLPHPDAVQGAYRELAEPLGVLPQLQTS
jgi:lipopolysaccharide/colanic/teichoic acid biosynthesis glycosyltransferase